ncbi:MAG: BspA family leucine-rich repeat surface protein, partial [Oscillibacter sp.]|nr:BspA family leucine-rich repeat surface protein [Oscillibacter sp.]
SKTSSESGRTVTNTYEVDLNAVYGAPFHEPWYNERESVKAVTFADKIHPTSTALWFYRCKNLERVDNIQNLDTANVTDMSYMFCECDALKALDLSNWNVSNVKNMQLMFCDCSGLTELNLSGFDTASVTNMSNMFEGCSSLTALDLSDFDTSSVVTMSAMFEGCRSLTTLNVSHFNTSNIWAMDNVFENCSGLTTLDLSSFDTSNVRNMSWMFHGCSGLTTLDVSHFDTAGVSYTHDMFDGCANLKTIYASSKFVTASVRESAIAGSQNMFAGCTALVGGAGTKYDESHIDKEYARIDTASAPGYFTDKNAPVTYTVTWKNYDGAVLKTDTGVAAGTVPAYVGDTPIRTGYAFAGWSPEPSALSGDATYTAQFTEIAPILFDVTRDAYAFGNSMADFGYTSAGGPGGGKHPITPNSFFVIFGETVKAKMLYKQKTAFPWGGNCAGMSGSAALFYANTGLNPSDFGQNNVWGVKIGDKNAEMSALTFVEAMQVAQYADAFVKARQENNRTAADLRGVKNLKALFEAVRTDMEAGRPTLIAIVKSGVGGHALLAIGAEDVSDTESRIRIYDCNHPGKTRYLTLGKDASGNLTAWSYDMGGHGVWGTGDENGDACSISYVPYAVLEEIWTNRGKQQQKSQVLTVNADNVSITDINGKPVASLENGQFSANAEGVYEIVELSMYWPKERSVCLPRNETYTLTTSDNITLTASMTDSHMSAEISTSANEVTFGVSDDERENSVMVTGASASDTYEIALESDFADMPYKNVSLSGSGQGEDVSVSMNQDGAPQYSNVNLTSLSLNGESVSLYKILLATKGAGKLTVAFTNLYPVTVAAAYFGDNGKFMSARLESVQASAGTAEFPLPTDAKTARVILCDSDCRPLCEPYEANIG